MFVGCSEISISVIVKHMQNIGLKSRLFDYQGDLLSFSVPGMTEKIAGLWCAWGDQYPGWHFNFNTPIIGLFVELD